MGYPLDPLKKLPPGTQITGTFGSDIFTVREPGKPPVTHGKPLERPLVALPQAAIGLCNSTLDVMATVRGMCRLQIAQLQPSEREDIADVLQHIGRCCYTLADDIRRQTP